MGISGQLRLLRIWRLVTAVRWLSTQRPSEGTLLELAKSRLKSLLGAAPS